jgi:hypothetical protein
MKSLLLSIASVLAFASCASNKPADCCAAGAAAKPGVPKANAGTAMKAAKYTPAGAAAGMAASAAKGEKPNPAAAVPGGEAAAAAAKKAQ